MCDACDNQNCDEEKPDDELPDPRRRRLLTLAMGAAGALGAAMIGVPIVGFVFGPLVRNVSERWRSIGRVEDFPVGSTKRVEFQDASPLPWSGVTARTAAWLRRDAEHSFTAFSVNCTHLGCPVRWEGGADLFMCPCHGGVYYKSGKVAAGPPPKPLPQYPVRLRRGRVEIRTSPVPIT